MDEIVYWIWLQQALGYASKKLRVVNSLYKSAEDFYRAGPLNWRLCGCFLDREISQIENCKLDESYSILDKCISSGYSVVPICSDKYPKRLKGIEDPPCVLYVNGVLPDLDSKVCISMVGARNASKYGMQTAFDIAEKLGEYGAIVISGGATGIDILSHRGAMQKKGKTVAVLGCGIDYKYSMKNAAVRESISKNGAVISEYIPNYPAYTQNFLIRNRIVSALSLGTVVVEAEEKSGSLATASLVKKQNRDLFAVPACSSNTFLSGTNKLIREGAKPVYCAEDILCEYMPSNFVQKRTKILNKILACPEKSFGIVKNADLIRVSEKKELKPTPFALKETKILSEKFEYKKPKVRGYDREDVVYDFNDSNQKNNFITYRNYEREKNFIMEEKIQGVNQENSAGFNLSFDEQKIYSTLGGKGKHIDLIANESNIPVHKVLSLLTNMELNGVIEAYAGKIYKIK